MSKVTQLHFLALRPYSFHTEMELGSSEERSSLTGVGPWPPLKLWVSVGLKAELLVWRRQVVGGSDHQEQAGSAQTEFSAISAAV